MQHTEISPCSSTQQTSEIVIDYSLKVVEEVVEEGAEEEVEEVEEEAEEKAEE